MSTEHPAEEDLVMLYYREAGKRTDALEEHLAVCDSCRTAYQTLVRVLEACDDLPVPEPHPAFEARLWNRLEPQLHPLNQRMRPWQFYRTRWFALASVAAMLIAAFVAGRFTRPAEHSTRIVAITPYGGLTPDGRQRVLMMALGDHLERSEMVLAELANGPDQPADLSFERERARNLVSENRLYRQTAADSGDAGVAQVLDELERVLLDISHGTDSREIKSRIESESLLFKLRVLGSKLDRTNSSLQPAAQETL
jgi:hypothetical protein